MGRILIKFLNLKTGVIDTKECTDLDCENAASCEDQCPGFKSRNSDISVMETIYDIGDTVICDYCNKDFTKSDAKGGFIFESKAICPDCAPGTLLQIKGYNETKYIKKYCPEGMTFKNFVIGYRAGNNTVRVIDIKDGESIKDIFKR